MSPLSTSSLAWVRTLVRERAAIVLEADKDYLIQGRLTELAAEAGSSEAELMVSKLRASAGNEPLRRRIVDAMTTNETFFFRDRAVFDAVRMHVLPDLWQRRRPGQLTLWSAAASTGQEAYGLAMTVLAARAKLPDLDVRIVATDLSDEAIARARDAVYSDFEVQRGLRPEEIRQHFERTTSGLRVNEAARRMVQVHRMNLAERWLPLSVDLLMLRNVLIYFDLPTKKDMLAKARAALNPGGSLVLGAAESTVGISDAFEPHRVGSAVFFRAR